jgi:hypothetical protein
MAGEDPALAFALEFLIRRTFAEDGSAASILKRISSSPLWKRPVAEERESFSLPVPQEVLEHWKQQPVSYFGSLGLGVLAPLFPPDSWPRTLIVEGVCLVAGQSHYTEKEIVRLVGSSEIGPVGYWMLSEAASFGGMDVVARRFAERALELCTAEGFRRDVALLEAITPGLIEGLGRDLVHADEEKVQAALSESPSAPEAPELRDLRLLYAERASKEPSELGQGLLDFLWRRRLGRWLFSRLTSRWPELLPDPEPPADGNPSQG